MSAAATDTAPPGSSAKAPAKRREQGAQEDHGHDKGHHPPGGGHGASHGGGAHEEHEGAPEWLISFADNVTLMMGFFVILLAINMKPPTSAPAAPPGAAAEEEDTSNLVDTQIAIREAFNNPVDLTSTDPNDLPLIRRLRQRTAEGYSERPNAEGDRHDVQSIRPGTEHDTGGTIMFDNDSVALDDSALRNIGALSETFRGKRMMILVRGHASSGEAFRSKDQGMRLSFERALAVAQEFARQEIEWRRLRLVACGDGDRLKPVVYGSVEHRQNAFVEVVATDEAMRVFEPDEPTGDPPATSAPSLPAMSPGGK